MLHHKSDRDGNTSVHLRHRNGDGDSSSTVDVHYQLSSYHQCSSCNCQANSNITASRIGVGKTGVVCITAASPEMTGVPIVVEEDHRQA